MTEAAVEQEEQQVAEPRIPDSVANAVLDAYSTLEKAERAFDQAHKKAQARKKDMEESQDAVNDLLRQARDGIGPLFGSDAEPEDWRAVHLDILGDPAIPESILERLAGNDPAITTMGELADFTAETSLTVIPHVGEKAVEKIEAVTDAFWARRKEAGLDDKPKSDGQDEQNEAA